MKNLSLEESLDIINKTSAAIEQLAKENEVVDFLYENTNAIAFNANDTFEWACSETIEIDIRDLPMLLKVFKLFGNDGFNAFLSLVSDQEVIQPLNTDKYKDAKEYLKDYKPSSWVTC